ncbi:MAG: hypothetical protein WCC41_16995 [Rhodomicrobium sp.]
MKHMQTNREFQLKLALSQDSFEHLAANLALVEHESERPEKILKSIYYDTPDLALHNLEVSLRVRGMATVLFKPSKPKLSLRMASLIPYRLRRRLTARNPISSASATAACAISFLKQRAARF